MPKTRKPRFGGLAPKYEFVMNPYPGIRISRCPRCNRKTGQRKVPLFIHVDPLRAIALNYTCRYCERCDLLIGSKHMIEHLLYDLFSQTDPNIIGNEYIILGTVEKKAWREALTSPQLVKETLMQTHQFRNNHGELRITQGGWYPQNQEPPLMEPPRSQEWVKAASER